MSTTQVVTIHPNGLISGLERKKGQGVDIKQFGKASVERSSLVLWNEDKQKWFVEWQTDNLCKVMKGLTLTALNLSVARKLLDPLIMQVRGLNTLYFDTYEEAVSHEIEVLDFYRINGLLTNTL